MICKICNKEFEKKINEFIVVKNVINRIIKIILKNIILKI